MTPIIWFLFQQNTFMPVLTLATGIVLNLLTGLLLCVLLVIKEKNRCDAGAVSGLVIAVSS